MESITYIEDPDFIELIRDTSSLQSFHSTPSPTTLPAFNPWICRIFLKYLVISYTSLWIVCIIVETLIVGFAMRNTEMNITLKFLIMIKIGIFVMELLLLSVNISLIGHYIGFSAPVGQSCLYCPPMKIMAHLTIFNWIIFRLLFNIRTRVLLESALTVLAIHVV
ncbi:unnamed protein product, partial [Medioppia subpectinata]